MKVVRLVCAALALSFLAGWATSSSACDNHKSTKATAAAASAKASMGAACTAEMAANCTAEMAAVCQAHMKAGSSARASGKSVSAVAASAGADCCAKGAKTSATAASAMGADHCATTKTSATAATAKGGVKATGVSAVFASSAGDHCGTAKVSAVAVGSNGACGVKGAKASAASASACGGHGMASVAAASGHSDCDACVDMADCSGELDAVGAHRQAVRLKNGIMYVYTAASPRSVSAVQAAVARRADRMVRFASAGEKAQLCGECKAFRGSMASGKLNREVVNIEGGSLTLVTSSDPRVVEKIHAMAEDKVAVRVKS